MLFNCADLETETENRDLSTQTKSTLPKFNHWEHSCVGSESCHRQKMIPKLFADSFDVQQKTSGEVKSCFASLNDCERPTELE